jgi:D-alanyl-lipoteichoic acid acyltransferase DltB (MBOAT superfamily)
VLFNSQVFLLVFLPPVLAAYYACGAVRPLRQLVLIGASFAFYAAWNWRFVPLLFGLTLANWVVARAYGKSGRRRLLSLGVALNLGVLGVFKYANFLAGNFDALIGRVHSAWPIVLPLGISFFVFQKISYLVDLKRGDQRQYGMLDFFEFVTFFPQLIAGPLVRHNEIIPQFARPVPAPDTMENISRGAVLFIVGLAKKAALADSISVNPDALFALAASGHSLGAAGGWAAAVCYTLQIYFDFSGYSDMAIGLALMFGLRLPFNFDAPYRAVSVRDFWRRWHLTLSRFLRDYVYIPLGGNRCSEPRMVGNLAATMLIGGLWHGAAWTFVAWGGWHGAGLAWNHLWARTGVRVPRAAGWALTLLFVMCGWVLFRAQDFGTAWRVLGAMTGAQGLGHVHVRNAVVVGIAALVAVVGPTSQDFALTRLPAWRWVAVPAGMAFAFLLLLVGGRVPNEFIYFQF